jgi:hypothetical protein
VQWQTSGCLPLLQVLGGALGIIKRQAHTINFLIGLMPFTRNQYGVTHLGLGNRQRNRGSPVSLDNR